MCKLNWILRAKVSSLKKKRKSENWKSWLQTNKIIQKSFTLYNCSKDQTHINVIISTTRWKVKIINTKVSTRLLWIIKHWKKLFNHNLKIINKAESSDLKGYDLIKLLNPFVLWIINDWILVHCWWWCLSTNKD